MAPGFGAFGKMPGLGDFFRVNLPQGFVETWDLWLQQSILDLRNGMGARWHDCYMSAPIWRFSLQAGLAGPQAMIGVLMASVDRVGRQYPLTLAMPLPESQSPILDHLIGEAVFRVLEGIALGALDDAMTREALATQLQAEQARAGTRAARIATCNGTLVAIGAGAQGMLPELTAALLDPKFRAPSVWSADVEGGLRLMVCEGLPGPSQMPGLFDLDAAVWQGATGQGANGQGAAMI